MRFITSKLLAASFLGSWLLTFGSAADELVLVPRSSSWKFLPGLLEASSPDTAAWRQLAFEDADWKAADAPFGFGDPPYSTDLSLHEPPMRGNFTCIFLRQTFEIGDAESLSELRLLADYDDGFAAWINGVEVLCENLRTGDEKVAIDNRAARSRESGTYETFVLTDPQRYAITGTNVLAVQAFNVTRSGNDFKIDVELLDPFAPDITPPAVARVLPLAGSTVRRLGALQLEFTEQVTGVDARDLLIGGTPAVRVTEDSGVYSFHFAAPANGVVDITWSGDHGIADLAPEPHPLVAEPWSYTLDPDAPPPKVVISEFLAKNESGLEDEDRERSDWIEVRNDGDETVALGGWSISDDPANPGEWIFPDLLLEPGGHALVFASAKDRRPRDGELHANFKLDSDGEYLGLFTAELPRQPVVEFAPYPRQRRDYSYGVSAEGKRGYYPQPTPLEPNDDGSLLSGSIADLRFTVDHGFFDSGFELGLSTPTPEATIYYTLDGSEPTPENGTPYAAPIEISGTPARAVATVRARAFRDGFVPSLVATRTYVFPDHVATQPRIPQGFPTRWGSAPGVDYEIDPEVVNNPTESELFFDGLLSIPALSIVADVDDIFGPAPRGIYSQPEGSGGAFERPCSAELMYTDGRKGFQIDCGIRILGGASRRPDRSPKHSFRLLFKGLYGPTRLRFRLFEDTPVDSFDTLVLRANYNNSWIHWDSGQRRRGLLIRDQWAKDTQNAMGHPSGHAIYVNLYVNGLYWGVYVFVERPSAPFVADYYGGEKEEYDVFNSASPVDGDTRSWSALMTAVSQDLSTNEAYLGILDHLDVVNFADYMLLNFYGSNADWPHHNWYGGKRRSADGRFRFFSWDAERILEGVGDSRTGVADANSPGIIHARLRANAEYRLLFADRAHRHLFNGGVLTPESAKNRFEDRVREIETAVVAESARWGDYRRDVHQSSNGPYEFYRRETHFVREWARLEQQYFPQRSVQFLRQLQAGGGSALYPRIVAPVFNRHGGVLEPGFSLTMEIPDGGAGTVHYTLDGSDPRVFGSGEVSPAALVYSAPISIDEHTVVKARTLDGTAWSALNEATFTLPPALGNLRITEIMYHATVAKEFEFVELWNRGAQTVDLSGLRFTNGIVYEFAPGDALPAGAHLVIVAEPEAFSSRYPGVDIAGVYRGTLDNGGEKLTLKDRDETTIVSIDYDDEGFWPIGADGFGYSLVLADADGDPDAPATWRASAGLHGSPGGDDPTPPHGGPVLINEVLTRADGGQENAVELRNWSDASVSVGGWYLSDSRVGSQSLKKYRIPDGTEIPPGDFLVILQSELEAGGGDLEGFELGSRAGAVFLASSDADGEIDGYIVGAEYEAAESGVSFGIEETSSGLDMTPLEAISLGTSNGAPRMNSVVINEIHYHPADEEAREPGVEFIELFNGGDDSVSLHDAALGRGWRLDGVRAPGQNVDFEFSATAVIPAGGYLLISGSPPGELRARHPIPDTVLVVGPFDGALDNGGERLTLLRPVSVDGIDGPDGTVGYARVDRVEYNDKSPWPVEPDGLGPSMERLGPSLFGNEALNWAASTKPDGTPGAINSVVTPPSPGLRRPGDFDGNGQVEMADQVLLLSHLFRGPESLPCGDSIESPGTRALLDSNADSQVWISDAVHLLVWQFLGGPPHALGLDCVEIESCPSACE